MRTVQPTSNEQLESEVSRLRNENAYLHEQLNWFKRQMFGQKSEKIIKNLDEDTVQLLPGFEDWFDQTDNAKNEEKETTVAPRTRKASKNKGKDSISYPEDLPVERIEIDLPENEKFCAETGEPLQKIGEEISRKLAHKPGSYFIKEYVRPIYAFPKKSTEGGIRTAELPDCIISKCRADESLIAEIITKKFADHLPLYRISEGMGRDDIRICRQQLSNWVVKIGLALKPLYDLMLQEVLKSGNIFIDESPVDMLMPGKGKTHQGYMWVIAGGRERDPPNRIYKFALNRKHQNTFDLIGDYEGTFHSDKYGAYEKLAMEKKIMWCPCFSHIRRKFFEAETDPEFRKWILRKIKYLFLFEKVAWNRSPDERLKIRQEKEIPIIDELISAVKNKLMNGKILPKSKLKEALGYFCSLVPYLKNYTKDPWARLDNNIAERAIRPLVIGRKNWLFVGNEKGGEAAAVLLTLVQTCRSLKINPREYLEDILRRFMSHPHQKLYELLPDNWATCRNSKSS